MRIVVLIMLCGLSAHADEPPPLESHALSASRDAPVVELAYGPRAQLSVGDELRLVDSDRLALSFSVLTALENANSQGPIPDEVGRLAGELTLWSRHDDWGARLFGAGGGLSFGFSLGLERARKLGGLAAEEVVGDPRPGDIPFGGGGDWTGFEVAARFPVGDAWLLLRVRERVFLNAWALLVGRRDWSDDVSSTLEEGLAHAPSFDAALVWDASPCVHPTIALFAEALFPHDLSAGASGFARLLAGASFATDAGELLPFLSLDVGAGKGLLINRHELRLSIGVRRAF